MRRVAVSHFVLSLAVMLGALLCPEDFNHPGVQQERKEDAAMLFKMVDELPENQRTAFILNKVEDMSYREIGDILSISEAAVDSLLQRAKQNLRKKLSDKINGPP